jgi:hypothetical protein
LRRRTAHQRRDQRRTASEMTVVAAAMLAVTYTPVRRESAGEL